MEIYNPQLWWTHDLGEPTLYTLQAILSLDGTQLEQQQQEVGIRTLELDQSPDTAEPGTRFFRFVLNGVPIFVRGACWIPAHSFVGALKAERYAMLLKAAQEANMNMLRVWGGGIYEHDVFYELCNRSGILVWQDFMFACAMYPEDKRSFVDEVEAEARYQVRRLRNHPCLALWCGNNENQWIHDRTYWDKADFAVPGSLYYNQLLPQIVKELDGKTPYWPGSPYGGNDYSMLAQAEGLKFGIEHYRRRKPHCSGTLIWQLNDCWPVLSWSIVDYYGFGKAGYFYTRRAYAAVMASFQKGNDGEH